MFESGWLSEPNKNVNIHQTVDSALHSVRRRSKSCWWEYYARNSSIMSESYFSGSIEQSRNMPHLNTFGFAKSEIEPYPEPPPSYYAKAQWYMIGYYCSGKTLALMHLLHLHSVSREVSLQCSWPCTLILVLKKLRTFLNKRSRGSDGPNDLLSDENKEHGRLTSKHLWSLIITFPHTCILNSGKR